MEDALLERTRERIAIAAPSRPTSSPAFARRALHWVEREVLAAPLVLVLHPSVLRMRALGLLVCAVHLASWFVWSAWLEQPYENAAIRVAAACLALLLVGHDIAGHAGSRISGLVLVAVLWFALPFACTWLYVGNAGNGVSLATMAAAIVACYCITDWRIASLSIITASFSAGALFRWTADAPAIPAAQSHANAVLLGGCMACGIVLGVSAMNQRREQFAQRLASVAIVAHQLRTPLSTLALVGDAIRGSASEAAGPAASKLELLASRLHTLVRNMNHQIDLQLSNLRLDSMAGRTETVWAGELVQAAIAGFPFRSSRERGAVRLTVQADFAFRSSHLLFTRVIENLLKNALRSLAAAGASLQGGDVSIEIGMRHGRGRIVVADRGAGIDRHVQRKVFEPFFSTQSATAHGLGLTFCRVAIERAGGTIRVASAPSRGTVFLVELPACARP